MHQKKSKKGDGNPDTDLLLCSPFVSRPCALRAHPSNCSSLSLSVSLCGGRSVGRAVGRPVRPSPFMSGQWV